MKLKKDFGKYKAIVIERYESLLRRFQTLSKSEKSFAAAAAALIIIFLADAAVIRPIRTGMKELEEKIRVVELATTHSVRSISQKARIDNLYLSVLGEVERSNAPDEELRSDMLKDVEGLARSSGLDLSEVKPQISVDKGEYRDFAVRIQADGDLQQLSNYFARLVSTKKMYLIDSFRVVTHPEDLNKIRATVTVVRRLFPNR
jgi:hypothetical protein